MRMAYMDVRPDNHNDNKWKPEYNRWLNTLLIIGTRDRTAIGKDRAPADVQPTMGLYNELGKKTAQQIPDSQLVELDDVGHMPHIEVFDRFIEALLGFLK